MRYRKEETNATDKLIFTPHTGGGKFTVYISGKPITLRVLTGYLKDYNFSEKDINRLYFVVDPKNHLDSFDKTDIYQFLILNNSGDTIEMVGWQWVHYIKSNCESQKDGTFSVSANTLRSTEELLHLLDNGPTTIASS